MTPLIYIKLTNSSKPPGKYVITFGEHTSMARNIRLSIENMELYSIPQRADPPESTTCTEIRIWEKSVNDYVSRKSILHENVKKLTH
jgi:hypothetical protein